MSRLPDESSIQLLQMEEQANSQNGRRLKLQLEDRSVIKIDRNIHTWEDIKRQYGKHDKPKSIKEKMSSVCTCSKSSILSKATGFVPIVNVIRTYKLRSYITGDIISGVSASCLHFPQGLAFGLLSSLAPAYGLYTSFFPVLFYMIFGTSAHVSFGTNAVLALITAEVVQTEAKARFSDLPTGNTSIGNSTLGLVSDETILEYKAAVAAGTSLLSGIILLLLGLFRLGFITTYLSRSFIGGFTTAAAIHIATSQLTKVFGIKIPLIKGIGKLILTIVEICKNITSTNVASLIIAVISCIIIGLVQDCINQRFKDKLKMPIPVELILVILATVVSYFGKFNDNFGVKIVGKIPSGIPVPVLPDLSSFGSIVSKSFELAILSFFMTIAMAKLCALKHEYEVDDNQELLAYGIANLGSSFFRCFASCTAPPRTMILSAMGAKTTLNAASTAVVIFLVIMVVGQLFTALPVPVLAAMIIMAVRNLIGQLLDLPKIFRTNKYDFAIWTVTCSAGVFLDLPYGLLAGIFISLYVVVLQSQNARSFVLEKTINEDIYLDRETNESLSELHGIKIFRMEASLYFATAELFRKRLYDKVVSPRLLKKAKETSISVAPTKGMNEDTADGDDNLHRTMIDQTDVNNVNTFTSVDTKFVIFDCRCVNFADMTGIGMLTVVFAEYKRVDITIYLAACTSYLVDALEKADFFKNVSREQVFFELEDAVQSAKQFLLRTDKDTEA